MISGFELPGKEPTVSVVEKMGRSTNFGIMDSTVLIPRCVFDFLLVLTVTGMSTQIVSCCPISCTIYDHNLQYSTKRFRIDLLLQ